ncbi:hypothetical protein MMC06_003061 [Schaereria dolodes]|nr:hypothetical protein [Schaereria dolodes]
MSTSDNRVYPDLIQSGIEDIKSSYQDDWCLPRFLPTNITSYRGKKHKLDDEFLDQSFAEQEPKFDISCSSDLYDSHSRPQGPTEVSTPFTAGEFTFPDSAALINRLIYNPSLQSVPLIISSMSQGYQMPPQSRFLLANINESTAASFSRAAQNCYPVATASAGPAQFDFVLLDPPWENRSVRRSKRYKTARTSDPTETLKRMMSQHIACDGLVAIWITNKRSVRESALEMFEVWSLELIEEWVWLKTTMKGEPICEVAGLWRKPYEILLLGRKVHARVQNGACVKPRETFKRLIVGVPDLHSRKPNIQELIEPLISNPRDYRALEIFARNLTSGWWAWGNEVLKFNWKGHWSSTE